MLELGIVVHVSNVACKQSVLHVVIIHVTVFHKKRVKYWRNDKIDLYKPAIFSLRVNSPPQFIVG